MYRCINKIRNYNGAIEEYIIKCEETGKVMRVTSDELHNIMKKQPNSVINLKLTSNNRIIEIGRKKDDAIRLTPDDINKLNYICKNSKNPVDLNFQIQQISNLNDQKHKLDIAGMKSTVICNGNAIAILSNETLKVVSNTKIHLTNDSKFRYTNFRSIDLRNTCPDEITDASEYFHNALAQDIYLDWSSIPYLTCMTGIFSQQYEFLHANSPYSNSTPNTNIVRVHGLETINTSNVWIFVSAFEGVKMNKVDISKWNLCKIKMANQMFKEAMINELIIGNHPESKSPENTRDMFEDCTCDKIDLSGLVLDKIEFPSGMFNITKARQGIDLRTKSGFLVNVQKFFKPGCETRAFNPFNNVKSQVYLNKDDYAANRFYNERRTSPN
jgi:uncharacterized protein YjbI with pentapeptide repeats